ncbi:hypothetical protein GCM10009112_17290 [Marinomonas arenicola]
MGNAARAFSKHDCGTDFETSFKTVRAILEPYSRSLFNLRDAHILVLSGRISNDIN